MGHSRLLRTPGGERIRGDGRGESGVRVYLYEQPIGRNVQSMPHAEQCKHRNIAQPPFDLTDIRAPYTRSGGECLLRQASVLSILSESRPKTL
jgi:hypothetical protein